MDREVVVDGVKYVRPPTYSMTKGSEAIAVERDRQVVLEHWTPEHDDEHDGGEIALAAVSYICHAVYARKPDELPNEFWPWDRGWFKPPSNSTTTYGQIRMLEKAGALLAAEIDRLWRRSRRELEAKTDEVYGRFEEGVGRAGGLGD